jgi:hypothetical protein
MSPFRALLLVAAAAAPVAAPSGCRAPRARLEALPLPGARPEQLVLRCQASGFPARPRYSWRLPAGVRAGGSGQPLDEDALLVQLSDGSKAAELVECSAIGDGGALIATARLALGPSTVSAAKESAGVLSIDGSGFPAQRGDDDAVWLIPGRGPAVRADSACKAATWSETKIAACLPKLPKKTYHVRVQSGGRLALGPSLPLGTP